MRIFTVIAIVLFGFWFVGLVLRASLSRWLRRRAEEFNRAAKQAQKESRRTSRREGEVTVEGTAAATAQRKVNRGVGEYVEFEEIEE